MDSTVTYSTIVTIVTIAFVTAVSDIIHLGSSGSKSIGIEDFYQSHGWLNGFRPPAISFAWTIYNNSLIIIAYIYLLINSQLPVRPELEKKLDVI